MRVLCWCVLPGNKELQGVVLLCVGNGMAVAWCSVGKEEGARGCCIAWGEGVTGCCVGVCC